MPCSLTVPFLELTSFAHDLETDHANPESQDPLHPDINLLCQVTLGPYLVLRCLSPKALLKQHLALSMSSHLPKYDDSLEPYQV